MALVCLCLLVMFMALIIVFMLVDFFVVVRFNVMDGLFKKSFSETMLSN